MVHTTLFAVWGPYMCGAKAKMPQLRLPSHWHPCILPDVTISLHLCKSKTICWLSNYTSIILQLQSKEQLV